jgi:predicted membrane channel-forming protein YqfA (hemolysin III family)
LLVSHASETLNVWTHLLSLVVYILWILFQFQFSPDLKRLYAGTTHSDSLYFYFGVLGVP